MSGSTSAELEQSAVLLELFDLTFFSLQTNFRCCSIPTTAAGLINLFFPAFFSACLRCRWQRPGIHQSAELGLFIPLGREGALNPRLGLPANATTPEKSAAPQLGFINWEKRREMRSDEPRERRAGRGSGLSDGTALCWAAKGWAGRAGWQVPPKPQSRQQPAGPPRTAPSAAICIGGCVITGFCIIAY